MERKGQKKGVKGEKGDEKEKVPEAEFELYCTIVTG